MWHMRTVKGERAKRTEYRDMKWDKRIGTQVWKESGLTKKTWGADAGRSRGVHKRVVQWGVC